ncbi:TIGR00282 family metallophosphoesterase [Candidatus Babeliales bacterium]|nr:TIGR00282 family metallophosphoesterase [Candidatus Babeliales bacterium]
MNTVKVILLGDVVGETGRKLLRKNLPLFKELYKPDLIIVNGENSAHGKGITPKIAEEWQELGVDVITTGNHVWDKQEIIPYLKEHTHVLRPANYPEGCPGVGVTTITKNGHTFGVINVIGRVFMGMHGDCPFRKVEELVTELRKETPLIFVDFHAEATSEKLGMGYFLEGKVSAVVGTHTHIQTADARILPGGTAYITDLGMAGSLNSMIGVTKDPILNRFLYQMPQRHEVAVDAPFVMSGVVVTVDAQTGKALKIESIYKVDEDPLD